MRKLTKIIASISIPASLILSGCSGFTIGGREPANRYDSYYKDIYEQKADEMQLTEENAFDLVDCYGSIKKFNKMDNIVEKITQKNLEKGMRCEDLADKYNRYWKRKK